MYAFDDRWHNQTLEYNLEKHDWPAYWLSVARELFPQITSLEKVHEVLTPTDIYQLQGHLQKSCDRPEFADRVDTFYSSIIPGLIDEDEFMIQRFFTIRVVMPNQQDVGRLLGFHQGVWVGNGLGLRTVWTPFTECYGTNSMQMLNRDDSEKITRSAIEEKWSYKKLQDECVKYSQPVTLVPGQSHLFDQTLIHGNVNNETDITRWSMDGRILVKGGHYHRKLPGGYFRFNGERPDNRPIDTDKTFISYASWNSKWSSPLPLPMQRGEINRYCEKHGIKLNDYQFENEYMDNMPALAEYIKLKSVDGIVLCSVYCLPDNPFRRHELLKSALQHNVELHFANELTSMRTQEDLMHIQRIFDYVNDNPPPNTVLDF